MFTINYIEIVVCLYAVYLSVDDSLSYLSSVQDRSGARAARARTFSFEYNDSGQHKS